MSSCAIVSLGIVDKARMVVTMDIQGSVNETKFQNLLWGFSKKDKSHISPLSSAKTSPGFGIPQSRARENI